MVNLLAKIRKCRVDVLAIACPDKPEEFIPIPEGFGSGGIGEIDGRFAVFTAAHCCGFNGGGFVPIEVVGDKGSNGAVVCFTMAYLRIDNASDVDLLERLSQVVPDFKRAWTEGNLDAAVGFIPQELEEKVRNTLEFIPQVQIDSAPVVGSSYFVNSLYVTRLVGHFQPEWAEVAWELTCVETYQDFSVYSTDGPMFTDETVPEGVSGSFVHSKTGDPVGVVTHVSRGSTMVVCANLSLFGDLLMVAQLP